MFFFFVLPSSIWTVRVVLPPLLRSLFMFTSFPVLCFQSAFGSKPCLSTKYIVSLALCLVHFEWNYPSHSGFLMALVCRVDLLHSWFSVCVFESKVHRVSCKAFNLIFCDVISTVNTSGFSISLEAGLWACCEGFSELG